VSAARLLATDRFTLRAQPVAKCEVRGVKQTPNSEPETRNSELEPGFPHSAFRILHSTVQRAPHPEPRLGHHVRVDLRCLHALMSQQFLDRADVVLRFEEMRGEAVSQRLLILHINCLRAGLNIGITRATAQKLNGSELCAASRTKSTSFDLTMVSRSLCRAGCSIRSIALNCRKNKDPA
jgi:hypothetical protein